MLGLTPATPHTNISPAQRELQGSIWPMLSAQGTDSQSFAHSLASTGTSLRNSPQADANPFAQPNHPSLSQYLSQTSGAHLGRSQALALSDRMADTAQQGAQTAQETPLSRAAGPSRPSLSSEMKRNIARHEQNGSTSPSPELDPAGNATNRADNGSAADHARTFSDSSADSDQTARPPSEAGSSPDDAAAEIHRRSDDRSQDPSDTDPASTVARHTQQQTSAQTFPNANAATAETSSDARIPTNTGSRGQGSQAQTGNAGSNQGHLAATAKTAQTSLGRTFAQHFTSTRNAGQSASSNQATTNSTQSNANTTGVDDARASTFRPQVIRGMLSSIHHNGGSVTMRLEPQALGALRVQMTMTSKGQVSVQFHTATPEARQLLSQSMESLKTAMEQHGLKVQQVTIQPLTRPSHGSETPMNQDSASGGDRQAQQRTSTQHDAGGYESRGSRENQQQHSRGDTAAPRSQPAQEARPFQALHENT